MIHFIRQKAAHLLYRIARWLEPGIEDAVHPGYRIVNVTEGTLTFERPKDD